MKISKKNKRYAVKDGSIYSKVTGRLVAGFVKNGVLKVPEGVKSIGTNGIMGQKPNTIIVPSSVTSINELLGISKTETFTCICKGKIPPTLINPDYSKVKRLTVFVPKKCATAYQKKWVISDDTKLTFIEQ